MVDGARHGPAQGEVVSNVNEYRARRVVERKGALRVDGQVIEVVGSRAQSKLRVAVDDVSNIRTRRDLPQTTVRSQNLVVSGHDGKGYGPADHLGWNHFRIEVALPFDVCALL